MIKFYQNGLKLLRVKNLILNLFMFILRVLFDLITKDIYKYDRFFDTLLEISFEFILGRKSCFIPFFLYIILLLLQVNSILKELGYKRYVF